MSEPYPVRDLSSPFDNSADAPPPLYNPNYDEPPAFPAPEENSEQTKARVIESFQSAILKSQVELVHLLLDTQLFHINDLPLNRQTFLCAALSTGQNNLAREFIVKYGADVNAWSIEGWDRINRPIYRTPLMVAASKGNYAAVKMLMEEFGVDDGVVGADGMIALRCAVRAAKDGVGEGDKCVEYLPMRRSGGWKRFKHDHDITMRVVKKTTKGLIAVGKFFVYDLPKFLFWDFPKWLGKKVYKMCKATYEGTLYFFNTILPRALKGTVNGLKNLSKAMAKFIASIPGHLVDLIKYLVFEVPKVIYNMCKSLVTEILPKAAVETWNGVVRVSKFVRWVVVGTAKWTWTLCTRRIPKWIWEFTKWFFRWLHKIIFIRLPKLIKEAAMALKRGAIKVYETIVGLLASIASTIHTFVAFIVRSLGKVTLKDVFNSIYNLIHYVVVVIPTTIAKGIANGFKFVIDAIPKIFGFLGEMMVLLGKCLFVIIMFVPMSIGKLVWEFVKWVGRGIQEVMVWINPKAKVGR